MRNILMKITMPMLFLGLMLPGWSADSDRLFHIRLNATDANLTASVLTEEGFDVLEGTVTGSQLEMVVNQEELDYLHDLAYTTEVLAVSRALRDMISERRSAGGPADYPDLSEIQAQMGAFATEFPNICKLVNLTVEYGLPTFEGREIFALKISDNVAVEEDEASVLVVSNYHAREIVTPIIALNAMDQFTSRYGIDPAITAAVDNNEIWIAPTWNPDGYNHVFEVNNLWRKNRRVLGGGVGVDLNRNHAFGWDSACGGSTSVSSDTYRGPEQDSEIETQTMVAFARDRGFERLLDYHSSGREVLWSYDSFCNVHPFDSWMEDKAEQLSIASGYGGSRRPPSANGEHYEWQLQELGVFAYLIETHTTFQPLFTSALAEAEMLWPGILWLMAQAVPLRGHVTDAKTGLPLSADISVENVAMTNGERFGSNGRFGRYHFWAPTGQYQLRFSAKGYQDQLQTVTLVDGSSQTLEVALLPDNGCRGDTNGDDSIKIQDTVTVINDLGQAGGPSDLNGDGLVELSDVLLQIEFWGGCLP